MPLKKDGFLEIIGVLVKRNSVADSCTAYANNYKFGCKEGDDIWHLVPMGYAAIINHANTKTQQNCEIKNVRAKVSNKKIKSNKDFFAYSGEAVYRFIRDIDKDEELLGDYGHEWRKHEAQVNQLNRLYTENELDWNKFLSYKLYNMPLLQERVPC
jgi:hypothetical protein